MKYHVSIIEKLIRSVEVEAANKEEAENIVMNKYYDGEYVLTPEDYAETEFEVNEV